MSTNFFIITGISGAGKSQALKSFEDMGFFCVDNLPTTLIPKFGEIVNQSEGKLSKVALGIDIREGEFLDTFFDFLNELKRQGFNYKIIFLEANTRILVRRYSETRRRHPLGKSIIEGIREERKRLTEIKARADKIIDTSNLTPGELKEVVTKFLRPMEKGILNLSIISFGYKYGLPPDVDLIFDVRFLPNPQYENLLRNLDGNEEKIQRYVLDNPVGKSFLKKFFSLIEFLIPWYIKEGKSYLTIGIGCTGGKHRSVVVANALKKFLEKKKFVLKLLHRDIDK
ncbi:MAG TPA: RNase adapter RapZ [Elusimicrobia bacterium]|jgi:UPF0042 nucleotide-binding protein|nr:RNase adapter RapZ [Elusimicrobiota bacterium]